VFITHGGGFVPYQLGRFQYATKQMKGAKCQKPFESYLRNFYFENSVHDVRARRYLVNIWGADNIVVGSNFDGWDQNDGLAYARDMVDDDNDLRKICAGNAVKLFKLEGFGR
jgi:aminocarboxymuconate-semialdehyde decarboxylase